MLFGWVHYTKVHISPSRAVVICNPLGVEYMSGHRSIRHLADHLALSGIPALRFDYAFTGDSSGGDFTNSRVESFICDIRSAISAIKAYTGISEIILLGIGIGASFAALASNPGEISNLILWNPTTSGRRFVREQKLMSELLSKELGTTEQDDDIDAAGVYLTPTMQEDFRNIDLTKLDLGHVENMLLITREEMKQDEKLISALLKTDINLENRVMAGYQEMMASPTDTVVPINTLKLICEWASNCNPGSSTKFGEVTPNYEIFPIQLELMPCDQNSEALIETPAFFNGPKHLFGIVSRRVNEDAVKAKTAYVFLNCGSEHHAGPHRIYTILARKMASQGYTVFRFDI